MLKIKTLFVATMIALSGCAGAIVRDHAVKRSYESMPPNSFGNWISAMDNIGKDVRTHLWYNFTVPGPAIWADYDTDFYIAINAREEHAANVGVLIPRNSACAEQLQSAETGARLELAGGVHRSTQKRLVGSVIVADSCSFGRNPEKVRIVE